MGNICRSPAAEGIMKHLINKNGYYGKVLIDSAGTLDYHENELPDARMRKHAMKRGYVLDSKARQINYNDLKEFDYILTMDDDVHDYVLKMDIEKKYHNKILKMTEFSSDKNINEVPDPYYGGDDGFEFVLDILEDSTKNLLKKIKPEIE